MSYLADLEALTADEYRDEAERERQFDLQEQNRHAESGMGDTDDGSERAW